MEIRLSLTSCHLLMILTLVLKKTLLSSALPEPAASSINGKILEKKMILILVDGVRYDYVKDPNLKGFQRMAKKGVRAEYVQPIFPANSYPNWYTIVTGLYGESHGMVQNFMYDPKEKDTFLMFPHPNASHPHWWNQAEPLWVTSEKQGVRTAVYWWDGCQIPIRNMTPSYCLEYQSYWTWPKPKEDTIEALKEILDNFQRDEWQLALLYYEAVDATGHAWGPESNERIDAMKDFDEVLMKLQDEVESRKMDDEVVIVVVSDHGMLNVDPENKRDTKLIDIDTIIDPDDISVMLDRGSTSFLYPVRGREEKVYQALVRANRKGLRFYQKAHIPEEYHIKNNERTAPILLVADKGYFLRGFPKQGKTKPVWDVIYSGHHGYDPYSVKEMRTIMYARGPGLKKGFVSKPLMMTDHYNLVCHLMDVEAQPNNGSWIRVQGMLREETDLPSNSYRQSSSKRNHSSSTSPTSLLLMLSSNLFLAYYLSFHPISLSSLRQLLNSR